MGKVRHSVMCRSVINVIFNTHEYTNIRGVVFQIVNIPGPVLHCVGLDVHSAVDPWTSQTHVIFAPASNFAQSENQPRCV